MTVIVQEFHADNIEKLTVCDRLLTLCFKKNIFYHWNLTQQMPDVLVALCSHHESNHNNGWRILKCDNSHSIKVWPGVQAWIYSSNEWYLTHSVALITGNEHTLDNQDWLDTGSTDVPLKCDQVWLNLQNKTIKSHDTEYWPGLHHRNIESWLSSQRSFSRC